MDDAQPPADEVLLETPDPSAAFVPPSVHHDRLLSGDSYTHFSPIPPSLLPSPSPSAGPDTASGPETASGPPCALGVDEAGRGPVLGPMVYGVFFLPLPLSDPLLRAAHHFDDSKALTPAARARLMRALCAPGSDLHASCGWAVASLSPRAISAAMLRPAAAAPYNLNAQALDATVDLIRGVYARGVNLAEIYVDTVGPPAAYQDKLQRLFPAARVTVAKKADSLFPCVSAASVCAKVTRDAALEALYAARGDVRQGAGGGAAEGNAADEPVTWGSGYPSDARCVAWMRANMHLVFGWGPECRFSWGTARDMLEAAKGAGVRVEWPVDDDGETARLTDYFGAGGRDREADELGTWFGTPAGLEAF